MYYTFQCSFYVIYFLSWLIWNIFTRSKDDSSLSSIIYQMKNTFYKSIKKVRVCCINLHPLVVNVTIIEMVFEVCRRNIGSANLDFFFDEGGRLRNNHLYQGCPWPMFFYSVIFSGENSPPPPSSPFNHVWDDVKRVNLTGIRYNRERNILSVEKTVISSLPM